MAYVKSDYDPLKDESINEAISSSNYGEAQKEYSPFNTQSSNNYKSTDYNKNTNAEKLSENDVALDEPEPNFDEFKKKQEELESKSRELNEMENSLKKKFSDSMHNFPPVPSCCPFESCFFQDIEVDIPVQYQKLVYILFYSWLSYVAILLWNMVVCLAYFVATIECNLSNHSAVNFTISLFNIIALVPASYVLWFRPVYKAFKYESSVNFFIFFFVFSFQFITNVFQSLAIDGWGFVGILNCLDMFTSGQASASAVGVFMLITGIGFGMMAIVNFFLLMRVHQVYKTSGGSLVKAKEEFAMQSYNSKDIKEIVTTAVKKKIPHS